MPPRKRKRLTSEDDEPIASDNDAEVSKTHKATVPKRKKTATNTATRPVVLRDLPICERQFWKPSVAEQMRQDVIDKNSRSVKRELSKAEVTTLALNEVAAEKGRGYFMWLPSREVWKTPSNDSLIPVARNPLPPGSQYPSIVLMNFVWSDDDRERFRQSSHRARYLRSSALVNNVPPSTPVYPIQFAHFQNFHLFATYQSSLVVFSTPEDFFVTTTAALEGTFGRKQGRVRGGEDPEMRLEVPVQLWAVGRTAYPSFSTSALGSVEELYDRIMLQRSGNAGAGEVIATLSMGQVRGTIPRPYAPKSEKSTQGLGAGSVAGRELPARPAIQAAGAATAGTRDSQRQAPTRRRNLRVIDEHRVRWTGDGSDEESE